MRFQEVKNLIKNAWDWDINEFAKRLGKSPSEAYVEEKFVAFQKAATGLRQLDETLIGIITAEK